MLKSLLLFFFVVLTGGAIAQKGFTIQGKISGFPDRTKFYLVDLDLQTVIDSVVIRKNEFRIKGIKEDVPQTYRLYTTVGNQFYYCNVFMGNEAITVTGSKKDFPYHLSYKGSPSQELYQSLHKRTNPLQEQRDTLMKMALSLASDTTKDGKARFSSLLKLVKSVDSTMDATRMAFIRSHLNSYVGLKELNFLKSRFDKLELQRLYDAIREPYKESMYGKQLLTYIEVGDPVKKGDMAFDFQAMDTSGKMHALSDLKGRYVLLDFGYASCGACMLSLPELKKMDSIYRDRMSIVSFSTDRAKEVWRKSILRDRPSWLSLWDGKGSYARPVLKYNVTGYPTFVLIDPEGKVVWTGSGYGDGMFAGLLPKYIK